MAYEQGSATGIADLMGKLAIFAGTTLTVTPWTVDEDAATQLTLSRGNCVVSWAWEATDPDMMGVYQSLGWLTSVFPSSYTDDSGGGPTSVPNVNGRQVNFLHAGPYSSYHFFAGEGSTPYIHVVVEVDANRFRHFGFGNLVKYNDYTGGEYCYGHRWDQGTSSIDIPSSTINQLGLDANSYFLNQATVRVVGLPNQDVLSKWGSLMPQAVTLATDDRGGDPRAICFGSARAGLWGRYITWMRASLLNSYKPMVPIEVLYKDLTETTPTVTWLGHQPDISIVNMGGLAVGDTVTIAGDGDWIVFPWVRKLWNAVGSNTEESWNAGFAYKKIV